ncbi:NADPH--hemoprotein reductase [Lachancea thermotolerans CBS 6340]|uniref:NADPH--cytochrome P450 reductase n=1 Tax=Lachancea thermotolerans (strain ATCC 56472 / CBS 6340 / NRRL Y-8284) TaxID=559295 RepID=C5DM76_LACTC|nr:KLTH0G06600p [Lachancea thermotolerans CBS 6340]CAR24887.1 KLTH0G06600p [Lachancea thermotolerans CBS 6340]
MPLGLDTLDFAVLCALALAVSAYLGRDTLKQLFASNDESIRVNSDSRDIVQTLKDNNKNYLVLYGSQTGTAEDYAKKFAKELAAKFSLRVMCADVEKYDLHDLNELPEGVVVSFFISTYGEGDFPDGAVPFEDFLNSLNSDDLNNLRYTLFGLGNSTYEFFNGAGKKTHKLLSEAGATILGKYGEADDGAGTTDEDYLGWADSLLEILKTELSLDEHEQKFEPSFHYSVLESGVTDKVSLGEPTTQYLPDGELTFSPDGRQTGPFDPSYPFVAPIVKSKELFNSDDRNCIHAEFDISGSNLKYSTGDHLALWPSNSDEKVEQFLSCFGLDSSVVFDLKPLDTTVEVPFPVPTTIGAAVRYYLEITGPISRQFFSSLVQFAPNDKLKDRLNEISKDKDEFAKSITAKYLNLADALLYLSDGAKWNSVPWNFLAESVPRLQPRYYSISSSSLSEKQTISVTAIVENMPNPSSEKAEPVTGVATNLLRHVQLSQNNENVKSSNLPVHYDLAGPRNLFSSHKLPVHVRRSAFRLPSNPATPVIMIGPGTGVAPFRGFIRDRVKFAEQQSNVNLGKHLLFYGSRDQNDFLYQEEWPEYSKKLGGSFELIVAHSRLPGKPKCYVQDKIKERDQEVFDLISKKGAFIYVCGDAKGMAQGVHATLVDIISKHSNVDKAEATEMLKLFKTSGKYQEDVW